MAADDVARAQLNEDVKDEPEIDDKVDHKPREVGATFGSYVGPGVGRWTAQRREAQLKPEEVRPLTERVHWYPAMFHLASHGQSSTCHAEVRRKARPIKSQEPSFKSEE